MTMNWKTLGLAACAALAGSVFGGTQMNPKSFGALKDMPVYIQEWHVWWGFPYPDRQQPFSHMSSTLTAEREPWRLNWNRNGYPLVGLYDAANPEIMRWQIRCMKAAGLTSVALMIHPEWNTGIGFIQEEQANIIQTALDIAAEENFPIFFMDEVAFRHGSAAQKIDVSVKRITDFIKKYGSHPGFYKVDGKPFYYFQTYGWKVSAPEIERMCAEVDRATGGVYWAMFGPVTRFGKVPQLSMIVDGASIHRRDRTTREWRLKEQDPAVIFANGRKFGKKIADMQYPKFDGTGQPWRQTGVAQYGMDGRMLETTLLDSLKAKPDFIMLSSWNDWEEGANFEPGWDFDGFAGDPYTYCKVIAHLKGVEFVPPPPPPKEAVHPAVWEKLGYGDGAGPLIERIDRSHVRGGALTVTVRDSAGEVTALEAVPEGDLFWKAPQTPGGSASGTLQAPKFSAPVQLANVFGFTPGRAVPVKEPSIEFRLPGGAELPDEFAVGVAWAFNPEKPLQPVQAVLSNRIPVKLREPKGGVRNEMTLDFTPYPRSGALPAENWNGWQVGAALIPRPADLSRPLKLQANGVKLGLVSLLGAPRDERTFTNGEAVDSEGKIKKFHITLPDEILAAPGAHFLWLRARDAAGNWGSPVLYAVPNYEFFDREARAAVPQEPELQVPGAILADNCSRAGNWKGGSVKVETVEQKQLSGQLRIANSLVHRDLKPALDRGGFHLTFDANHSSYQRKMIVWLTDAAGKHGYGVAWDSAKPDQAGGSGVVQIVKLASDTPLDWNNSGKVLAAADSGHPAVSETPARFEFLRNGDKLTVRVDGKPVVTAADPDFKRFDRLYLRGNDSQTVDRIILTP